jgi:hypothetical protein
MKTEEHKSELLGPGDGWVYDLWTCEDVAQALKVTKQTVYRWVRDEQLGHFVLPSDSIRLAGLHVRNFLHDTARTSRASVRCWRRPRSRTNDRRRSRG